MLRLLKSFFVKAKQPDITPTPEPIAPYKVEAPTIIASGEPPATVVVVEPAKRTAHPDNSKPPVTEQKPVTKKAPVKKKPAATKTPAKPRTPRKPKATK